MVEYFPDSLLAGFRPDLLEIWDEVGSVRRASMRDPEPPNVESEAMQAIRAWRATERKKLIESMDKLLAQAQRLAESQYTRSGQRAKWTRLAGQLLWTSRLDPASSVWSQRRWSRPSLRRGRKTTIRTTRQAMRTLRSRWPDCPLQNALVSPWNQKPFYHNVNPLKVTMQANQTA